MLLYTAKTMASTRTQIYLTAEQRKRLDELGKLDAKPLAQLIREAVDLYLDERTGPADLQAHLDRFFGSMPDLEVPPRRWGRDVWAEAEQRARVEKDG
jgi:hypothetical protein